MACSVTVQQNCTSPLLAVGFRARREPKPASTVPPSQSCAPGTAWDEMSLQNHCLTKLTKICLYFKYILENSKSASHKGNSQKTMTHMAIADPFLPRIALSVWYSKTKEVPLWTPFSLVQFCHIIWYLLNWICCVIIGVHVCRVLSAALLFLHAISFPQINPMQVCLMQIKGRGAAVFYKDHAT